MHPEIDGLAHIHSVVHRWDPRWKLATIGLLVLAFSLDKPERATHPSAKLDLPPVLAGLAFAWTLAILSRLPLGSILKRLKGPTVFAGILVLVFSLTYPGERMMVGPVGFSREGLLAGGLLALRAITIVVLAFPAFATSPFDRSMKALRALKVPAILVHLLLFTYRYLFVYADQLRRMQTASRARGFLPRWSWNTVRTAGNGLGVLLVGSIERTERIQGAMKCRGFDGTFLAHDEFHARPADILLSALLLVPGLVVVVWRLG